MNKTFLLEINKMHHHYWATVEYTISDSDYTKAFILQIWQSTRKSHCSQRFIFRNCYSVHQIKTWKGKGLFKCSPVNFPVKRENYCFPYFYIRIFPRLCRITLIVIFARNFLGNLVQNFNFIFFIKFYILENNFVFYVSCINFRFLWKSVYSNSVIIYFTNLKHFVCLCWRYIFQVLPGMHVYIRNFSRVKTSS